LIAGTYITILSGIKEQQKNVENLCSSYLKISVIEKTAF